MTFWLSGVLRTLHMLGWVFTFCSASFVCSIYAMDRVIGLRWRREEWMCMSVYIVELGSSPQLG